MNQKIHACYIYLLCVYACARVLARVPMWRLENRLPEFVLSSHRVGPWDWTHVVRFSNKHLYWLSHLASLWIWKTEQQKPNLLWARGCFGCYCRQRFNQFFSSCAITVHSTSERWVLSLQHPPIETIFKKINKSAMLLLHLLKDEEGPTSCQTGSQLQQALLGSSSGWEELSFL